MLGKVFGFGKKKEKEGEEEVLGVNGEGDKSTSLFSFGGSVAYKKQKETSAPRE